MTTTTRLAGLLALAFLVALIPPPTSADVWTFYQDYAACMAMSEHWTLEAYPYESSSKKAMLESREFAATFYPDWANSRGFRRNIQLHPDGERGRNYSFRMIAASRSGGEDRFIRGYHKSTSETTYEHEFSLLRGIHQVGEFRSQGPFMAVDLSALVRHVYNVYDSSGSQEGNGQTSYMHMYRLVFAEVKGTDVEVEIAPLDADFDLAIESLWNCVRTGKVSQIDDIPDSSHNYIKYR